MKKYTVHYEPISLATDMWSVGCLTYVLLTGYSPFGADDRQTTFCNITQAKLEFGELFEDISNDAIDFIKKLLVKEPKKRISCKDALNHPWLSRTDDLVVTPTSPLPATIAPTIPQIPQTQSILITPAAVVNQQQALISPTIAALAVQQQQQQQMVSATATSEIVLDNQSTNNDSDKENN